MGAKKDILITNYLLYNCVKKFAKYLNKFLTAIIFSLQCVEWPLKFEKLCYLCDYSILMIFLDFSFLNTQFVSTYYPLL